MSKTKREKQRKPNLLKQPSKLDATLYDATTMKVVESPVPGRFYAVDHAWWDDHRDGERWISLVSMKRQGEPVGPTANGYYVDRSPLILDEISCGSIIFYLGKEWVSWLHEEYYKIGYGEYFGYIGKCDDIVFYDLGEDDSNESQTI